MHSHFLVFRNTSLLMRIRTKITLRTSDVLGHVNQNNITYLRCIGSCKPLNFVYWIAYQSKSGKKDYIFD